LWITEKSGVLSGRHDAALYGSQDGRRYAKHMTARKHGATCTLAACATWVW